MSGGKTPIAVFISGRGSNMLALADACADPAFPAGIALVASDVAEAAGLEAAAARGLETAALHRADYPDKAAFEATLDAAARAVGAELICLAGFMRVLSARFVSGWAGRMLNIHPSLLPSFPGLDTHARALAAGVKIHGATVHEVTAKLDDGPIVAQAALKVREKDDAGSLAARLLPLEHQLYPLALERKLRGPKAGPALLLEKD